MKEMENRYSACPTCELKLYICTLEAYRRHKNRGKALINYIYS